MSGYRRPARYGCATAFSCEIDIASEDTGHSLTNSDV
jgi:hypothetical protein